MNVFKNDIVYVYEYKNRNNIKNFNDLIKIIVTDVQNGENIVSGNSLRGNNYILNSNDIPEKTSGIVKYKKEGELLTDGKDKFFITCNPNRFEYELKDYSNQKLYSIMICLKLDENVFVKLRLNDMNFDNIDSIYDFIDLLKITHMELHPDRIRLTLNKIEYDYFDFEVYYKEKYINSDYKRRIFDYACKNKNAINNAQYDFNKVFSLKFNEYEIFVSKK